MSDKKTRRSTRQPEQSATPRVTKVTLRLDELVAKRLGVESVMTGESQSDIANRVLGAYLAAWRLPSKVGIGPTNGGEPAGTNETAA